MTKTYIFATIFISIIQFIEPVELFDLEFNMPDKTVINPGQNFISNKNLDFSGLHEEKIGGHHYQLPFIFYNGKGTYLIEKKDVEHLFVCDIVQTGTHIFYLDEEGNLFFTLEGRCGINNPGPRYLIKFSIDKGIEKLAINWNEVTGAKVTNNGILFIRKKNSPKFYLFDLNQTK